MHALSLVLFVAGGIHADATPDGGSQLLSAFTDAITTNTPYIVGAIGAVIGLVFLIALGGFIVKKVRSSVGKAS